MLPVSPDYFNLNKVKCKEVFGVKIPLFGGITIREHLAVCKAFEDYPTNSNLSDAKIKLVIAGQLLKRVDPEFDIQELYSDFVSVTVNGLEQRMRVQMPFIEALYLIWLQEKNEGKELTKSYLEQSANNGEDKDSQDPKL